MMPRVVEHGTLDHRNNASCRSINYETGLCVLFSSSADQNSGQLSTSQFPVFTIYLQKNCLPSAKLCDAAWSFERVFNYTLDTEVSRRNYPRRIIDGYVGYQISDSHKPRF